MTATLNQLQPARTRRNIEKSDGTVIFSLERVLSGGPSTLELANKSRNRCTSMTLAKSEYQSDSLRLEIQALTDVLCSNKTEILNVAGPRGSKELGVYEWTLTIWRFSLNRTVSQWIQRNISWVASRVGEGRVGDQQPFRVEGYFNIRTRWLMLWRSCVEDVAD